MLYESHLQLEAKMISFAGFLMPLQYAEGIRKEHNRVREHLGLFDVSHMGQIRVQGQGALSSLQWMTSNNVDKLNTQESQYSLLTNFQGGIIDDVIIYCVEKNRNYLICVNAINKDKDLQWMIQNQKEFTQIIDESSYWALIAIQGPKALDLAALVFGKEILELRPFAFIFWKDFYIARTGYTGEKGLEVFVPKTLAKGLWRKLLKEGQEFKVGPIGLGARDSLRTEMKYPLYGHEIDQKTNPIEAGLGWAVKFKKGDFIGREKILKVKQEGPSYKLIGFKMLDQGIPRQGYNIHSSDNNSDKIIGRVTSGIFSPALGIPIGIGYVSIDFESVGSQISIAIRQKLVRAEVVKTPFIKSVIR